MGKAGTTDDTALTAAPAPPAVEDPALAVLRRERDAARAEVEGLKRRLAEAERLADRDPLTPVLNRRAFVRELQRTSAFCARYASPASLIYLDLDGFKAVNDRHGHAAGDAVLAWVAATLVERVRETDVVGRLGGDEFAVLLVQTDGPAAAAKASALASAVGAEPLVFEGVAIPVTISAGVRDYEAGLTPARWLAEADAAMFVRKGAAAGWPRRQPGGPGDDGSVADGSGDDGSGDDVG